MTTKVSKSDTVLYVLLLTVVPQIILLLLLIACLYLAYWFSRYGSFLYVVLGAVGVIAYLFACLSAAIFTKCYGLSIFAPTRKDFDVNAYSGEPIKKIDYYAGRKNTFTVKRSIYVREREVPAGGPLIASAIMAVVIMATGVFKFIIEAVRVCLSDDRQSEWESCRQYLIDKRDESGAVQFFQTPIIVGIVFAVILVICFISAPFTASRYNPEHIGFNITEKENSEYNNRRIHVLFYGEIVNNGSARVEQVEASVYFKDADGNLLYQEDEIVINVPLSIPSQPDDYLSKGESWNIALSVMTDPSDEGGHTVWESSIDDIEISMDITSIWYDGDKFIDFPEEDIVVIKPIKNK